MIRTIKSLQNVRKPLQRYLVTTPCNVIQPIRMFSKDKAKVVTEEETLANLEASLHKEIRGD